MDILKRTRILYDLKYSEANGIGQLKLPTNSKQVIENPRQANLSNATRQSSCPPKPPEQEITHRRNVTLTTARMTPEITPNKHIYKYRKSPY